MTPFIKRPFETWGRVTRPEHAIATPTYVDEVAPLLRSCRGVPALPVGLGRSYGDSALNADGRLIQTTRLDRILKLADCSVQAESGLSLGELLKAIVPRGYFLPTTPGTRFVTLGGAIANDVHGKNHHAVGSFGCAVRSISLVRSDYDVPLELTHGGQGELFAASIGGLGLTGVITSATISLVPITSAFLDVDLIPFGHIRDFFALANQSAQTHEHTVAWIDCASAGKWLGRGIFQRANWCRDGELQPHDDRQPVSVPLDAPRWLLNPLTIRSFNALYYYVQRRGRTRQRIHYAPFFYPLDSIGRWNRLYGSRGFFQYQCVVPPAYAEATVTELLAQIARWGQGSFLAVLKMLGPIRSPGLLSFPLEGATLALDFANKGDTTLALLDRLDRVVLEAGGRLYPAKDGRMPAKLFQASYPDWRRFASLKEPQLNSDFWRRVSVA